MVEKHTTTIRFLSWNTWLLPDILATLKEKRVEMMPEFLKNFDVIGLNEVFDEDLRETLVNSLKGEFPHHVYGPSGTGPFVGNSGLVLLSRYEIEDFDTLKYEDGTGGDYFANKGAVFARLRVPLEPDGRTCVKVNVFSTHTQATTPWTEEVFIPTSWFQDTDHEIRYRQLLALSEFARKHYDGHPTVLMGDLNVTGESGEYTKMMDIFSTFKDMWVEKGDGSAGYTYDEKGNIFAEDSQERLDYILLSNDGAYSATTILNARIEDTKTVWFSGELFWDLMYGGEPVPLSDHFGVSAEIKFQPTELRRRTFSIDPALVMSAANDYNWPRRMLYEYGRYVILGFRRVQPTEQADIRFLYQTPFYWSEGYWKGGIKVPKVGSPLLHHVNRKDGTREIYINPTFNWVTQNSGATLDLDTKTLSLPYALLHMAGHAVGLVDIADENAVMGVWNPTRDLQNYTVVIQDSRPPLPDRYSFYFPPRPRTEEHTGYLTQTDITELCKLYGQRPLRAILPRAAPDVATLDRQIEQMLDNVTSAMLFKVPWSGVQVPRISVRLIKLRWWGSDDNGLWEDDEVRYEVSVSAASRNGNVFLNRTSIYLPGKDDGYEMTQGGDSKSVDHFFIRDLQVAWSDVEAGIVINLEAHVWEDDGFLNFKDDDYGWRSQTVVLSFHNHGGGVRVAKSPWAVDFVVTLSGLRDYPNLYHDELDRRNQQAQMKAQFKSGATVSKVTQKVTQAFTSLKPEVGGQPIEELRNAVHRIVSEEIEELSPDMHLVRSL